MKKNLKDLYCQRPHVVIVGAGASRAVMGKSCPTMNEAIEQVGLDGILKGFMLETKSRNLEDIYSELFRRGDCLLYTSPSPRDKRQTRMPSSA